MRFEEIFIHCSSNLLFMSDIVIVIIGAVTLVGGVILYAVITTSTGMEEDVNQNYIPDWMERMVGKDPTKDK